MMTKKNIIYSPKVRKSPWYAHAVRVDNLVYTSGITPVDPLTGKIEGDIKEQTRKVLTNLKNVLEEASSSLENVIKVTAYLENIDHFDAYNDVYGEFFPENNRPARTTIQVGRFRGGMLVEIEVISLVNG
jgi:2-iminobutanoate/2-iminopropanoate deaminase